MWPPANSHIFTATVKQIGHRVCHHVTVVRHHHTLHEGVQPWLVTSTFTSFTTSRAFVQHQAEIKSSVLQHSYCHPQKSTAPHVSKLQVCVPRRRQQCWIFCKGACGIWIAAWGARYHIRGASKHMCCSRQAASTYSHNADADKDQYAGSCFI